MQARWACGRARAVTDDTAGRGWPGIRQGDGAGAVVSVDPDALARAAQVVAEQLGLAALSDDTPTHAADSTTTPDGRSAGSATGWSTVGRSPSRAPLGAVAAGSAPVTRALAEFRRSYGALVVTMTGDHAELADRLEVSARLYREIDSAVREVAERAVVAARHRTSPGHVPGASPDQEGVSIAGEIALASAGAAPYGPVGTLGREGARRSGVGEVEAGGVEAGEPGEELVETSDPLRLVPGSPTTLLELAERWRRDGQLCADAGSGLTRLDTGEWAGPAAAAFAEVTVQQTTRLHATEDALGVAAGALERYVEVLGWAQREAAEAVAIAGAPLSSRRGASSSSAADGEDSAGAEARRCAEREAEQVLRRARSQLEGAGADTARELDRARALLPPDVVLLPARDDVVTSTTGLGGGDLPGDGSAAAPRSMSAGLGPTERAWAGPAPVSGATDSTSAKVSSWTSAISAALAGDRDSAAAVPGSPPVTAPARVDARSPGREVVVRRGDTLAALAARYLGDQRRWPELFLANVGRDQPDGTTLRRPGLLQPGWTLTLPDTTGQRPTSPATPDGDAPPDGIPDSWQPGWTLEPPDAERDGSDHSDSVGEPGEGPGPGGIGEGGVDVPDPDGPGSGNPSPGPTFAPAASPAVSGSGVGVDPATGLLVGGGVAAAAAALAIVMARRGHGPTTRAPHRAALRPGPPVPSGSAGPRSPHSPARGSAETDSGRSGPGRTQAPASPAATGSRTPVSPPRLPSRGDRVNPQSPISAAAREAPDDRAGRADVPVGVLRGREVALDVLAAGGVTLAGAAAVGVARALLLAAIRACADPGHPLTQVVVPGPDLPVLIGAAGPGRVAPPGVLVVADVGRWLIRDDQQDPAGAVPDGRAQPLPAGRDRGARSAGAAVLFVGAELARRHHRLLVGVARSEPGSPHSDPAGVLGVIAIGAAVPLAATLYLTPHAKVGGTWGATVTDLLGAQLHQLDTLTAAMTDLDAVAPDPLPEITSRIKPDGDADGDTAAEQGAGLGDAVDPHTTGSVSTIEAALSRREPRSQDADSSFTASTGGEPGRGVGTDDRGVGAAESSTDAPGPRWVLRVLGRPVLALHPSQRRNADPELSVASEHGLDEADVSCSADEYGEDQNAALSLSPRMRELLVLLAAEPDGVHRDQVVEALWPTSRRNRPGNNLSSLLSRLRAVTAVGDSVGGNAAGRARGTGTVESGPVVVEGEVYRLDRQRVLVDFWTFAQDLDATRHRETELTDQQLRALRRAHGLYRGPFGEGIDNDWILGHQQFCRRAFLDITALLVRHDVRTDPAQARIVLERSRNIEPLNERLYTDIMALQLRIGDTGGAELTYQLLASQLADIDQQPSPQTTAMLRASSHGEMSDGPAWQAFGTTSEVVGYGGAYSSVSRRNR